MNDATYSAGARAVLPLAFAIAPLGAAFGVIATTSGLSATAAIVMSATTFAGSAQFAAVSIFGTGGTIAAAVGTAALLNARYIVMGTALAATIRGPVWRRFLLAQLGVDESWAVAYLGQGRFSERRLIGAAIVLYAAHVGSTAAGTAGASMLGDPRRWGLDTFLPALLLVLVWPHVQQSGGLAAALGGAAIALVLTPVAPPGLPIVAAAASAFFAPRLR